MKTKVKKFVKNDQVEAFLIDVENQIKRIQTSINDTERFQGVVRELNQQLKSQKIRLKQLETLFLSINESCDSNSDNFSKELYIALEETNKLFEAPKDTKTIIK